jgi:hypothetical protein
MKGILMNCPLCGSNKSVTVNESKLKDLKERWMTSLGFNPFPKSFGVDKIKK